MIRSGSLTPGVDSADFGLPAGTALRLEQPDPLLAPYIRDYHVFDSEESWHNAENWLLPAWPAIRIVLADRPIRLQIGAWDYNPLPVASLYGTASRAMRMITNGGVTIGANIGPLGWARLFRTPADRFRDRVVPLNVAMPSADVGGLVARLRASNQDTDVKAILDDFFRSALLPPSPDEALIRAVIRLLMNPATRDIDTAAAAVGINASQLRRLSTRYFGFPPKTLLLRTRFMRTFMPMFESGETGALPQDTYYHDMPHFLRDARRFIGTTPRRFLARDLPYLHANIRALRAFAAVVRAQEKRG
jgi:hypothetical protein